MNRRYYLLTALLLIITIGLLFLPDTKHGKERQPLDLMQAINNNSRFLTTDQVASRIIRKDPTILLIDVRDTSQYWKFTLEGAISIPLASLLDASNRAWLSIPGTEVVFFSNGDIESEKAWLIAFREGYDNLFIMRGGLNRWAETILKPTQPKESAPKEEFDLYEFRQGAGLYFKGGEVILEETETPTKATVTAKKQIKLSPPPPQPEAEGGC